MGADTQLVPLTPNSCANALPCRLQSRSLMDGQLFAIKQLLVLREQIAPFEADFAVGARALPCHCLPVLLSGSHGGAGSSSCASTLAAWFRVGSDAPAAGLVSRASGYQLLGIKAPARLCSRARPQLMLTHAITAARWWSGA